MDMEKEVNKKLAELEAKIEKIYTSVENTRKYLFWKMVLTITLFLLPIVGIIFAIPFLTNYVENLKNLNF